MVKFYMKENPQVHWDRIGLLTPLYEQWEGTGREMKMCVKRVMKVCWDRKRVSVHVMDQ